MYVVCLPLQAVLVCLCLGCWLRSWLLVEVVVVDDGVSAGFRWREFDLN
jgi:hypothetical protein